MQHQQKPFVATILANPEVQNLVQTDVDSVVDALQASGGIVEDVHWLAEGVACDVYYAVLPMEEAQRTLLHLLAEQPFDWCVQVNRSRRRKMLICDMDSTVIQQECIDELANFAGLKAKVAVITEKAMNGELDFPSALRERVALLKDMPESVLETCFNERITLTPGACTLVQTMRENGALTVLVSGGFTFFTQRVKEKAGFMMEEANILEIQNGALTGKVVEPILDKHAKLNCLNVLMEENNLNPHHVIAVGDGANDLPMLLRAGLGVAFHAHPIVREQVPMRIDTCDLSALLYVQGYSSSEIKDT
ncbi:MAG: phosphoserine phosphatase SerB [Hyphomicrobiales bacterium]|nr:phosphoserine phosphatase SerB [Hyphomicrobiales bacterium]